MTLASRPLPAAPLGRLGSALAGAGDVDTIATSVLTALVDLPGVLRVGFALTEGGGRRLRFTASDRARAGGVDWCHIDAYDDVPLTTVVRTGETLAGDRALLERRFPDYAGRQVPEVRGMAAVPLPGVGSPVGGFVLQVDRTWTLDAGRRRQLEGCARRTAAALARVRASGPAPELDAEDADDARLQLDDDPRSPGRARRFVRQVLAEDPAHDAGDVTDTAELLVSELVTNALLHAGGRSLVTVGHDERSLVVAVLDRGTGPAVPEGDGGWDDAGGGDPMLVHGRGLQLVEVLAERWGVERVPGGTRVWFSLRLDGEPAPADAQQVG